MSVPSGVTLFFAIVENNDRKSMEDVVAPFSEQQVTQYEIEPNLGIPFARNHVLDISLREECDFTTFVDDDETVDKMWLVELYAELTNRNLDLVGGPVRLHPTDKNATWMQKIVWKGLVRRNNRVEKAAKIKHNAGTDEAVTVITSNWMVRNNFLKKSNLRFREDLGFSGGSDVAFFKNARELRANTGWAPKALVCETQPASRLKLRYQYKRGRDQSISSFRLKYPKLSLPILLKSLAFILAKTLAATLLLLFLPFSGGATLTAAIRSYGFAIGRICALCGKRSMRYATVHSS